VKQILAMAKTDVIITFRTPIAVIMAFVMPIIFTAVLGVAMAGGSDEDRRLTVLLINEDGGAAAARVETAIAASEVIKLYQPEANAPQPPLADALDAIGDYHRLLVLPPGFSDSLAAGEEASAQLYIDRSSTRNMTAQQELDAIFNRVSSAVNIAKIAAEQAEGAAPFADEAEEAAYFESALQDAQTQMENRPLRVKSELATKTEVLLPPDGTNQSSPGSLVMFGLVTLLSTAINLVVERHQGTLRRLAASPLSKRAIIAGKTLGPLTVGVIQMAVLILVGQWVFGVPWGNSPLALTIMVLAFDLAAVSIGIFISTVVRTTDQATGAMIASSMVMAALGGAWWPMDITPSWMQTLGHFFPSAWAMDGFHAIILRGAGVSEIMLPALVLLGFAILFFSLGIWRFRYE